MKKILTVIAALFAFSAVYAQEADASLMPEVGDIRIGLGWGFALNMKFGDTPHSKPLTPIHAAADYTFMTFSDGKGSLAAGAIFEFLRYQSWSTQKQTELVGFKTTWTWTNGVLAGAITARYCLADNFEVFAMAFYGKNYQLGYKEEYSDESYAGIVPHTSGPGNSGADGIRIGFSSATGQHWVYSIYAGLGGFETIGFNFAYRF